MNDSLISSEAEFPSLSSSTPHPKPEFHGPTVKLLGCPIQTLTLEQTVAEVEKIISTRRPHQHCVVNAGKFVLMYRNPRLKGIVESCPLINADGQSVVWALRLLGRHIPERVTGIDLMERLFEVANEKRYRIYFLGAEQKILDVLLPQLSAKFPAMVIAGSQHGYFSEADNTRVVQDIARSGADILLVAMGSPKKEYWLSANLNNLNVPFCMGVGGSFDVVAGKAKRAPRWIQRIGMEWFFRFAQEPRRLWRRYWIDNFVFIGLVLGSVFHWEPHLQRRSSQELAEKEIT